MGFPSTETDSPTSVTSTGSDTLSHWGPLSQFLPLGKQEPTGLAPIRPSTYIQEYGRGERGMGRGAPKQKGPIQPCLGAKSRRCGCSIHGGHPPPANSPQAAAHDPSRLPTPREFPNSPPRTHLGRAGRVKRGRSRRVVLEEKGGRGRFKSRWHRSPRGPRDPLEPSPPSLKSDFPAHNRAPFPLFTFPFY